MKPRTETKRPAVTTLETDVGAGSRMKGEYKPKVPGDRACGNRQVSKIITEGDKNMTKPNGGEEGTNYQTPVFLMYTDAIITQQKALS